MVSNLEMDFPAVPSTLPEGMSALVALESLKIVGNNQIPSGAIPDSMTAITNLTSIYLEGTGLSGPIADDLLAAWGALSQLTMIRNPNMGELPPNLGQSSLQSLVVNNQGLTSFLVVSGSYMVNSLQILDLSSNAYTGPVFGLIEAFIELTELHLANNNFTGPLPPLPSGLKLLDMSNNPVFGSFDISSDICASSILTTCDMQNTLFSKTPPKCGACTF